MSAESMEPGSESEGHLRAHMRSSATMNIAPADLAAMLAFVHDVGKASPIFQERAARLEEALAGHGDRPERSAKARKISVSMPRDLTAAVQQRVGRGEFSQYVTAAVARQLELDLLAELSSLLEADHGAIPEEFVAEAQATWPDAG